MEKPTIMPVAKQKSTSVSHLRRTETRDQRVRRTRARIDAAFVELLRRRPYGEIRISDICKKAAVGRATFYSHYATKDDLLHSQFERLVAPMLILKPESTYLINATPFFAHVQQMPGLFAAFMGARGGTAPLVLRACFESRAEQALPRGRLTGFRRTVMARFLATTLLTVIECWFEKRTSESPLELQELFRSLVSPVTTISAQP